MISKSFFSLTATILFLFSGSVNAQSVAKFKVSGNCGMCEERIETVLDVKGVKSADWVVETNMLTVKYDPKKISEQKLMEIVAAAGHDIKAEASDAKPMKADSAAYDALHSCCQYKRME